MEEYPKDTLCVVLQLQRVIREHELIEDVSVSQIVRASIISAYERTLKEVRKQKLDKLKL